MKSELSAPHLHDEDAAFAYVEARLWPHGPVCPKCGVFNRAARLKGPSVRPGLWKCYACRKQFTVRIGTIFESSHVPMRIWLQAGYLLASSNRGISTRQLQRTFGGSMKTAWFLAHRIREAMKDGSLGPLGGAGSIVEADETYFGKVEDPQPGAVAKVARGRSHPRSSADGINALGGPSRWLTYLPYLAPCRLSRR